MKNMTKKILHVRKPRKQNPPKWTLIKNLQNPRL